ncbi:MAG: AhpC/TSA family protein [Chloroflexota bacterium]|nr:AhpC/TSA family protein [Chloroflexota bacterium]
MGETPPQSQRGPSGSGEARRADVEAVKGDRPTSDLERLPQPGDAAPDVTLWDTEGATGRLSDLWTRAPRGLALIFLRHFGSPFSRQHATQLGRDHARFTAAGLLLVAIGQGTAADAAQFQRRLKLPYPVLADPDRTAYTAYGLPATSVTETAAPTGVTVLVRALLRGYLPGRKGDRGSAPQLAGEFLIDRDGILRYAMRPTRSPDIPTVDNLIAAARDLL